MANVQRTMFAAQAVGFADLFKSLLGPVRLQGPVVYHPEISAPEGESTGAGKQATQHVMLVPESGGATLVMGSVNVKEKTAELRQFLAFAQMIEQRFKGRIAVPDREGYEALLDKTQKFFASQDVRVSLLAPNAFTAPSAARPSGPSGSAADEGDDTVEGEGEDAGAASGLSPSAKFMVTLVVGGIVLLVALFGFVL